MDPGVKGVAYKPYNIDNTPAASLYMGAPPAMGDAMHGIPLYPSDTPGNPRLARFVVQGCQDLWAALLFIGTVFITVIWGSVNLSTYQLIEKNYTQSFSSSSSDSGSGSNSTSLLSDVWGTLITLTVVFIIAVFGAFASLSLLRCFPRQLIYIANVLTVLMNFALAVFAFIKGIIFLGVMLLILCVLHAVWFYFVRHRIPFSAELLKASSDVLSKYKAIFVLNFLLSIACAVYTFFWGFMTAPSAERMSAHKGGAGDGALIVFFMFCFFWAMQVVPNLMHVTTAGVTATWYFAGERQMPHNPTLHSFKRATTTSFGSICFGSLIVAILRLLRWLAQSAGENENEFIRCLLVCIIQCLENLVEYFNTYAFVHVAVYGCGYIEAAKRTWALCKQCGFAAYFNDALVDATLSLLSIGVSALIGVAVGFVLQSIIYGMLAFCLSFVVHALFFTAVQSAVTTLFVCFAEMPEGLQQSAPELYAALHATDQNGTNNNATNL